MFNFDVFFLSVLSIFFSFLLDFEFICVSWIFIVFHFFKGISSVIKDYIYFSILKILFSFFLRIISLELIRYLFEFLF